MPVITHSHFQKLITDNDKHNFDGVQPQSVSYARKFSIIGNIHHRNKNFHENTFSVRKCIDYTFFV